MQLKIGFEIHQQLETRKLFCQCPAQLREDAPELTIERRLRPTQSELGEIDRAALEEAVKGRSFVYETYNDTTCLVEVDEEPPHMPNEEAVSIALEIALLLNATPVDELHFMRKLVIDGSNTSGFQRTAILAMDGSIQTSQGTIRVPTICLEEEAARKIGEEAEKTIYRLDRLGIPLVEISTAPEIKTPEQAREAALKIGELLRATSKVKRGIGTIRQDVNVSIEGGARVEIKGVQELNLIPKIIENEAARQLALLQIKEELAKRGVKESELQLSVVDVSEIFSGTESKIVANQINREGVVVALKLPGFKGLLKDKLGPELAQYAKAAANVRGIFHSDELPGYGISEEEVKGVAGELKLLPEDAFVVLAEKRKTAERALEAVLRRAKLALIGVPEETRMAVDTKTSYMRPLPGAARMYPETDIPPIVIAQERINSLKAYLPELFEEKIARYVEEHKLSRELAAQMAKSEQNRTFERIVKEIKVAPSIVANTLLGTLRELKREGVEVEKVSEDTLVEIFKAVERGTLAKEAISEIVKILAQNPGVGIEEILAQRGAAFGEKEVAEIVRNAIQERRDFVLQRGAAAEKPLMGIVMKEVRGRCDGALVSRILKQELEKFLGK